MRRLSIKRLHRVPRLIIVGLIKKIALTSLMSDRTISTFPALPKSLLSANGYSSQIGQDYLIDQFIFPSRSNGVFVDVGAHDGVSFSNTYFFESKKAWTGLCIEPNPDVFEQLVKNRNCKKAQVAIGARNGTTEFTVATGVDMLSGVSSNLNRRHRKRMDREIREVDGSKRVIQIPIVTLQSLLDLNNIERIDFLTIDTEGSELDVIRGIDFGRTLITCIVLERNYTSGGVLKFLRTKGFIRLMALSHDDIYVHKDWMSERLSPTR